MNASAKFWDKVARKYAKQPISDQESYQRKLAETQAHFTKDMQVLEVGCGTGSTAIQHAPYVQRIDAIDVSENMLAIARERALESSVDNVHFVRATLDEFNARDQSYDVILAMSVLHLIKERRSLIEDIARALKPGGVFISSTACLGNSYFKYMKLVEPLAGLLGLMPKFYVITEEQLAKEIEGAGFTLTSRWQHGAQDMVAFIVAKKR